MITPLGPLSELKLNDPQVCFQILSQDKHQIAEGMVVESIFDQIIDHIPKALHGEPVHILDVDTFITRDADDFNKLYAFILTREGHWPVGLKRYLIALGQRYTTYQVEYREPGLFVIRQVQAGRPISAWLPLADVMATISKPSNEQYTVTKALRDEGRQLSSFWGYLQNTYGHRLRDKVAIPRLLVNWGLQPWFRSVWNIDRALLVGEKIWALEAKHKFPFESPAGLQFGLNNGEAYLIRDLAECGINVLHTIIVKPFWDMKIGSAYLINRFDARENALVIGSVFDRRKIASLLSRKSASSPDHTSLTGAGKLNYKPMLATGFHTLSNLSDPNQAATNLALLIQGNFTNWCTDASLIKARLDQGASQPTG